MCMFKAGGSHNQINVVESLLIHMEEPVLQRNGGAAELQALASVHQPCPVGSTFTCCTEELMNIVAFAFSSNL